MLANHRKTSRALLGVGFAFAAALWAWLSPTTEASPQTSALVAQGTFRLHKFEQPSGEEKYSVQQDGDELQFSLAFHFNDRGEDRRSMPMCA